MLQKRLICPQRIRKVPDQFSWVDHRLIRDRYIDRCSHKAAALYLFLVAVADAKGLSYWSDPSIEKRLSMDAGQLDSARTELIRVSLIAYEKPLYQVLSLDESPVATNRLSGGFESLQHIFKHIREGI
jgi:hypothetical protein